MPVAYTNHIAIINLGKDKIRLEVQGRDEEGRFEARHEVTVDPSKLIELDLRIDESVQIVQGHNPNPVRRSGSGGSGQRRSRARDQVQPVAPPPEAEFSASASTDLVDAALRAIESRRLTPNPRWRLSGDQEYFYFEEDPS